MSNPKAIKILKSTYWNPKYGWVSNPPSENDLDFAINSGVMFPLKLHGHDETIDRALLAVKKVSKAEVVKAFLGSLESRRLEMRSALASYACGINLPLHSNVDPKAIPCRECASYCNGKEEDLNVLNFERYKFGGVRHLDPLYIALDLELFQSESIQQPSSTSIGILNSILSSLKDLESPRLSAAPKALSKLLKANDDERVGIISTLGYCGILKLPNYPPLYEKYTRASDRDRSSYSKSDWSFPADLWRPEYGLDENAISFWFGDYVS